MSHFLSKRHASDRSSPRLNYIGRAPHARQDWTTSPSTWKTQTASGRFSFLTARGDAATGELGTKSRRDKAHSIVSIAARSYLDAPASPSVLVRRREWCTFRPAWRTMRSARWVYSDPRRSGTRLQSAGGHAVLNGLNGSRWTGPLRSDDASGIVRPSEADVTTTALSSDVNHRYATTITGSSANSGRLWRRHSSRHGCD